VVYEVRVPLGQSDCLRVFDHDPLGHKQFEPGAEVHLGWNARDVLVFSRKPDADKSRTTRGE
jgi:putative spermidine/putrescine transport system ATP-binding protein